MLLSDLSSIVADWGGFEELVKQMHKTGVVSVERNVKRKGLSGAERQIDVLIKHKQGLYEHEVIAECKYWNKPVSRMYVDALATTIKETGVSKGAIFSTKGFQEGAIKQAKHENIELFTVRELTDQEWGLPGRHIDFWLRIITMSITGLKIEGASSFTGYEPDNSLIELIMSEKDRSSTPINRSSRRERTLEDLIQNSCVEAVSKIELPGLFRDENGDSNGIARAITLTSMNFDKPMVTLHAGGIVVIPKITFVLGVGVHQSRMQFDRAENSIFALAIEDMVTSSVHSVSRYNGEEFATILPIGIKPDDIDDDVLENGSIFSVRTSNLEPFDEFEGCKPGEFVFVTDVQDS